MANGQFQSADIMGEINRGLQFRQQQELRPLEIAAAKQQLQRGEQSNQFAQTQNRALEQQIDQRTDDQKNQSLFNTALQVSQANDADIIPLLEANVLKVQSMGGNADESMRALELAKAGDLTKVREGANNLIDIGVRQGDIKAPPTKNQELALESRRLDQQASNQRFKEDQAAIKSGELSATAQKILDTAQTETVNSATRANSLRVLASDVSNLNIGGGLRSTVSETFKSILGSQDDVTALRKKYNGVRASQAVNNLPPGAASDKDIALALSGFPNENANGDQIVSFLNGAAKLEGINSAFQEFKSNLISENGNTKGLIKKWKSKVSSAALGREVLISELYITAQESGLTIDDVKSQLGVEF